MQLRRLARGIGSRAQPPTERQSTKKRDLHFLDNFARPALFNVIGII